MTTAHPEQVWKPERSLAREPVMSVSDAAARRSVTMACCARVARRPPPQARWDRYLAGVGNEEVDGAAGSGRLPEGVGPARGRRRQFRWYRGRIAGAAPQGPMPLGTIGRARRATIGTPIMLESGNGYFDGGQGNRILDRLPAKDRAILQAKLSPVFLRVKTVLFEPGEVVDAVYFPLDGVISLVTPLEDGTIVEVATIGNEGMVGVPSIPGGALAVRAISQVAGRCLTMSVDAFRDIMTTNSVIDQLVQSYVLALFGQISQAAACNRLHTNEERLSRWLLMSHDRVGADKFIITQEFLAQMLGSRRATVTLSAGVLQKAGLIRYHRGHIEIIDRTGLESVSCECYRVIKSELDKVTRPPVFA